MSGTKVIADYSYYTCTGLLPVAVNVHAQMSAHETVFFNPPVAMTALDAANSD